MDANGDLREEFGEIDVYLFDQLLKGRFRPSMRVLDAGVGTGRNLIWFLREGYHVSGIDESPQCIQRVRELVRELAPWLPPWNFRTAAIEAANLPESSFDLVIANAVLHFARDRAHFEVMLHALWRALRPGGIFFARLASRSGIETRVIPLEGGRFRLDDGSERYLVDDAMLHGYTESLAAEWLEPLKNVVVEGARSMALWCLRKPGPPGAST